MSADDQPGPAQRYSVRDELTRTTWEPPGLYPSAVRVAVFRALWAVLVVLLAILGWFAVVYGDAIGW